MKSNSKCTSKHGKVNKKDKFKGKDNKTSTKSTTKVEKTSNNNGGLDNPKSNYDALTSNDIAWYDKAVHLYDEAVRVPFDAIAGAPRVFGGDSDNPDPRGGSIDASGVTVRTMGDSVPGIMKLTYVPGIGYSNSINSPANRAFTTIYGDIASKTTGAMQFQQADLALFVTSLSSLAGLIGAAKRLVEIANLYTPLNYYYPRDLITALTGNEADATTIINNRDSIRSRLNDLIFQFNTLRVPDFVNIFKRQYAMAHNVYADEDDVQAQLYAFVPKGYYQYFDTEGAASFTLIGDANGNYSINALLTAIGTALNRWRNSSDLPLINGALLRAYPDNAFISIDMINPDSTVVPIYDRNILWQINNCRTAKLKDDSLKITQDPANNMLIFEPTVDLDDVNRFAANINWVYLNSFDFNQSPEFIMESTRLIPYIKLDTEQANPKLDSGATEVVEKFTLYKRVYDADGNSKLVSYSFSSNIISSSYTTYLLTVLSKWRNAPRVSVWSTNTELGYAFMGEMGDLSHYTYLYPNQLRSLNEAALQSLFWVGSMSLRI